MKKILLVSVVLLLIVKLGYSQNSIKDTIKLNEVVVTGTKIEVSRKLVPLSINQINKKEIENSGEINVLPMLNNVAPSVFVTERSLLGFGVSTGGAGSISIRGVSGSPNTDVLILIDGNPQFQGIFGHPLPDAYVSSDIQKVEIIRGPASVLYGTNAMAGVINIITKNQLTDGLNSNINLSYGSYNTQKYSATLGYKKHKLGLFVSINHDHTDGYRQNTDFSIKNGYAKLAYEINKYLNITADYNIAKINANDNGPENNPTPFGIDILRGKTSFSLKNKYKKTEGALNLYSNFGTHDLTDGWHSTDHNSGIMLYQTYTFNKKSTLTIGSDYKNYGGKGNQGMSKNELKTINDIGLYSYYQQILFRKLSLNAGIRLEKNSVFGNETTPFGGLTFIANKNISLKGSVSKGFRSPTIMELYLFAPNINLQPEHLINYEISYLQTFRNRFNFELTGFILNADNIIQTEGHYPNITRSNSGSFVNKGIEFSSKMIINNNFNVLVNYNFLHLEKPVLAAPRQQFNISANYTYKIFNANLSVRHIDKLYTSVQNNTTQNYTLINARVLFKVYKKTSIFVTAKNLLNQKYEINFGYPMPETTIFAGIKINFNNKK